jgi:hypothetical protein
VDATITHVMESWPLQLALDTPIGREHVALAENVLIHCAGITVDAGALQPGQRVRIHTRTNKAEIADLEILREWRVGSSKLCD